MKIITLDGIRQSWNPGGEVVRIDSKPRSQLHIAARELLLQLLPTIDAKEEVPIPITRMKTLYLDFYIPLFKWAIEVHGEQHYKFVSHFHATAAGFITQRKNDQAKQEWCELNGIKLIVLPFNEIENWEGIINDY